MLIPIDFKVCVHCFTYNHAQYITDTLDGFAKQETDFPFVCVILDDCSTDATASVLANYLNNCCSIVGEQKFCEDNDNYRLSFARHIKNDNCYFAVYYLKYNHYRAKKQKGPYFECWDAHSTYLAMCEGDDYWIDPNKLEKQIEYLDVHKEVSICVHNAQIYHCATKEKTPFNRGLNSGVYNIRDVICMKWFTPTASFVYRNNFELLPIWTTSGCNGDMAILYSNLLKGSLYYDSEIKSVYRYGTPSSLSSASTEAQLVQKKINLYHTINKVSHNKYILYTMSQELKLRIMQTSAFRWANNMRLKIREILTK